MTKKPKTRVPRGRRDIKPDAKGQNQATVDEFDREGMGVASKE